MGMPNKSKRMLLKSGLALGLSNLVSIQEILAKNDPFFMMDATAQADLIKKGEVSAEEIPLSAENYMIENLINSTPQQRYLAQDLGYEVKMQRNGRK